MAAALPAWQILVALWLSYFAKAPVPRAVGHKSHPSGTTRPESPRQERKLAAPTQLRAIAASAHRSMPCSPAVVPAVFPRAANRQSPAALLPSSGDSDLRFRHRHDRGFRDPSALATAKAPAMPAACAPLDSAAIDTERLRDS